RLTSGDRYHRARSAMRTSIGARHRPRLHPEPAGFRTLVAGPLLSAKHPRLWRDFKATLGRRHFPRTLVTRNFNEFARTLAVLAVGDRTRQVPVLVPMLG